MQSSDCRPDALLAEVVGTLALVFAATGSIMVNDMSGGVVTDIGVAAAPGRVVAAMIYAVGDISAAHVNLAVTMGFLSVGCLPARLVVPYIASQMVGAVLASFALWLLMPEHRGLMGAHVPAIPAAPSVAMEVILTFFLMFVILGVRLPERGPGADRINRQPSCGLVVDGVVALAILVRRPHQRRLHEPGALPGPGPVRGRAAAVPVDLRHRAGRRRPPRRPQRPPHPRHQPIRNLTTGNSRVLDELPSHSTRPGRLQAQLAETQHRASRGSHSAMGQPGGVRPAGGVVAQNAGSRGHEPVPLCRQRSTVPGTL